jgi:hypothetical protein
MRNRSGTSGMAVGEVVTARIVAVCALRRLEAVCADLATRALCSIVQPWLLAWRPDRARRVPWESQAAA